MSRDKIIRDYTIPVEGGRDEFITLKEYCVRREAKCVMENRKGVILLKMTDDYVDYRDFNAEGQIQLLVDAGMECIHVRFDFVNRWYIVTGFHDRFNKVEVVLNSLPKYKVVVGAASDPTKPLRIDFFPMSHPYTRLVETKKPFTKKVSKAVRRVWRVRVRP